MKIYQNPHTDVETRVEDLLGRMTLEEMIMQTDQYFSHDFTQRDANGDVISVDMEELVRLLGGHSAGSIQPRGMTVEQINRVQRWAVEETRLGIPFLFSEEALHGFFNRRATSFPQQIGLAATFHPELGRRMGRAIAAETRALGVQETYSPVMDLIRDPRYGRAEESYGEDTFLCGEFARETVLGMQGEDLSAPDAVAAEPKHYVGYGAPVGGLNCAPAAMGRHEVFSDCLPVFEEAFVKGGATDAMCSYNSIDGTPVSADHELLTEILREKWGVRGFVRSDLTAVVRLYDWHFVAESREEAMAVGLESGVDLQLYDYPHEEWQSGLRHLAESGRLSTKIIRQACARVLRVKFLLGLFDRPYTDETAQKCVHCQEHRTLTREIARESIVLLKNVGGLLPLRKDVGNIAVLGPSAGQAALGDYTPGGKTGISILEGIRSMVSPDTQVLYDAGCSFRGETADPFPPEALTDEEGTPGLTGRYYNGPEPAGEPVMIRSDPCIDFNWIYAKPHPELDAGRFSVSCMTHRTEFRAIKNLVIQEAEDLRRNIFTFEDADMVEKYVDTLPETTDYDAVLDYYQATEMQDADDVTQAEKREALQALEQLWDSGFAMASYHLGRAWRNGLGVLPDDEKAEFWFRQSAEAGIACSQYAFGTLLQEQGQIDEAIACYKQAADAGNQTAQYHLGKLYLQGNIIPKDITKAEKYLTAAAEQGSQYAQHALGKLYLTGNEVMQDNEQAAYWLTQSATQGNRYAQFLLDHQNEYQSPAVLLSTTRLLYHMSRIFQETPLPSNPAGHHTESKLMQRIREKKIAAGHKPDDYEEHGYVGPVM